MNYYMTSHRTRRFSLHSEAVMRSIGVPIVDWYQLTQSRWDASYDGLHYAGQLDGNDYMGGQVPMMEYQVGLNALFPECTT